jgi:hypothetical protein
VNHGPGQQGDSGVQVTVDPPRGGQPAGQPEDLAGRLPIISDGMPTPPMTSFAASKSFSMSVDVISAQDVTLAGGASLNGGIILTVVVVDNALKGCMASEEMKKDLQER